MFLKSFRAKIIIGISLISLLPLMITNVYFYRSVSSTLKNNAAASLSGSLSTLAATLDSYQSLMETYSYMASSDLELSSALQQDQKEKNPAETFRLFRTNAENFTSRITFLSNIPSSYLSSYLYLPQEEIFMDAKLTFYDHIKPHMLPYSQNSPVYPHWESITAIDFYTLNQLPENQTPARYLSYIFASEDRKEIYFLNLDYSYIPYHFQNLSQITGGELYCFLDGKQLTPSSLPEQEIIRTLSEELKSASLSSGTFHCTHGKENCLAVYYRLPEDNMTYLYLLPERIYLGEIENIMPDILLFSILLFIGIIILCIYLTNVFYSPVRPLLQAIKGVQNNDLTVRITKHSNDEYQQIYDGFNDMMNQLNQLINNLVTTTSLRKDAEIKLLQAQMNPHFIYNTMESLYSLAKIHKAEDIALVIDSLSSFYRFSLSGGAADITIEDAVKMTKHYLTIQNFRFEKPIHNTFFVDNALLSLKIPKFALQAVVENAVIHGLEPSEYPGEITVKIYASENLMIVVSDTGIGMDPENLQKLQASVRLPFDSPISPEKNAEHFALRTLNQQIQLQYGDAYGLSINSTLHSGTEVIITLPYHDL